MLSRPRRPHQIRPTDPFLRWRVPQDSASAVVADGSCVAWIDQAHRPHPGWITSLGDDPETVALLVTVLHESHTAAGVTVPVAAEAWLGPEALGDDARYWSLWTLDPEVGEDDIPAVSLPPKGPESQSSILSIRVSLRFLPTRLRPMCSQGMPESRAGWVPRSDRSWRVSRQGSVRNRERCTW